MGDQSLTKAAAVAGTETTPLTVTSQTETAAPADAAQVVEEPMIVEELDPKVDGKDEEKGKKKKKGKKGLLGKDSNKENVDQAEKKKQKKKKAKKYENGDKPIESSKEVEGKVDDSAKEVNTEE